MDKGHAPFLLKTRQKFGPASEFPTPRMFLYLQIKFSSSYRISDTSMFTKKGQKKSLFHFLTEQKSIGRRRLDRSGPRRAEADKDFEKYKD
jgi:hypothetical protein